ncbi:hypothetical protein SAY86_010937 [Trapa natans]|uniref:Uncharacterized protein n=1 Tax=Trapa natans TaxID=22666 RepID=A0AAN7LLC0_TRANT|nr:hypothetical protein SAY86_010937 [Trapa natans]
MSFLHYPCQETREVWVICEHHCHYDVFLKRSLFFFYFTGSSCTRRSFSIHCLKSSSRSKKMKRKDKITWMVDNSENISASWQLLSLEKVEISGSLKKRLFSRIL